MNFEVHCLWAVAHRSPPYARLIFHLDTHDERRARAPLRIDERRHPISSIAYLSSTIRGNDPHNPSIEPPIPSSLTAPMKIEIAALTAKDEVGHLRLDRRMSLNGILPKDVPILENYFDAGQLLKSYVYLFFRT